MKDMFSRLGIAVYETPEQALPLLSSEAGTKFQNFWNSWLIPRVLPVEKRQDRDLKGEVTPTTGIDAPKDSSKTETL